MKASGALNKWIYRRARLVKSTFFAHIPPGNMASRAPVYLLLQVLVQISSVQPHPQCLDFSAPSKPTWKPSCTQYTDSNCCSQEQDRNILASFVNISTELPERCQQPIHDLMCQPCCPFAAHVFSAEGKSETRQFPGLCPYHCSQLEENCPEALRLLLSRISPELLGDNLCGRLVLSDMDYCYPSILSMGQSEGRNKIQLKNSEDCLCFEEYANNFHNPVGLKYSEDDSGRMFVVEQLGRIFILYENKTRVEKPFLDLRESVMIDPIKDGDERGLLGLAFHPDFAVNGRIFVYYYTGGVVDRTRLSEFRVSENPNAVDANSERVILEIEQPFQNHNAGEVNIPARNVGSSEIVSFYHDMVFLVYFHTLCRSFFCTQLSK